MAITANAKQTYFVRLIYFIVSYGDIFFLSLIFGSIHDRDIYRGSCCCESTFVSIRFLDTQRGNNLCHWWVECSAMDTYVYTDMAVCIYIYYIYNNNTQRNNYKKLSTR